MSEPFEDQGINRRSVPDFDIVKIAGINYLALQHVEQAKAPSVVLYKLGSQYLFGLASRNRSIIDNKPSFAIMGAEMIVHVDDNGNIYFLTNRSLLSGEVNDQSESRLKSPSQVKRISPQELSDLSQTDVLGKKIKLLQGL